jgi:hypothetical protein
LAKKKGSEIQPLNEDQYVDFEVNEFADADGLNEEIISLSDGAMPDGTTPIKIFSFNNNEGNSSSSDNTLIPHNDSQDTNEDQNTNDSSNILSSTSTDQVSSPNSTKVRGLTPAVNGESFDIKRCYQFRASTLKKLNQIKGESDNVNIYLNEIIDQAICHYYNCVFSKK